MLRAYIIIQLYGSEQPITCWCAVKKLLSHSRLQLWNRNSLSQIPLHYLVRTSFEPDSVMEFGRESASSCYSSLLAS